MEDFADVFAHRSSFGSDPFKKYDWNMKIMAEPWSELKVRRETAFKAGRTKKRVCQDQAANLTMASTEACLMDVNAATVSRPFSVI